MALTDIIEGNPRPTLRYSHGSTPLKSAHKIYRPWWLVLLWFIGVPSVYGEDYQQSVTINYRNVAIAGNTASNLHLLTGRFYFAPVEDQSVPYAEDAFLSRTGYLSAGIGEIAIDIGDGYALEGDVYQLGVTYDHAESPLLLEALFGYTEASDHEILSDLTQDEYSLSVGYFISKQSLVTLSYDALLFRETQFGTDLPDYDRQGIRLGYKNVEIHRHGGGYRMEAQVAQVAAKSAGTTQTNTDILVSGNIYLSQRNSFGGAILSNSGEDPNLEGQSLSFNIERYLRQDFALQLAFTKFFPANSDVDSANTVYFSVSARI